VRISEIFKSIQGEGPLVGRVAVFLRLAGCNLRCVWCDTVYAREGGVLRDVQDVVHQVVKLLSSVKQRRPLLVVTGGEPLLQADPLVEVLRRVREAFPDVEIQLETNGTLSPRPLLNYLDYIVVSPKLSNSGNPPELRRLHPDYRELVHSDRPCVYLKFVIDKPEDIREVLEIMQRLRVPNDKVYLMPQCRSAEEQLAKLRWLSELAVKYSLNLTLRLQYLAGFK